MINEDVHILIRQRYTLCFTMDKAVPSRKPGETFDGPPTLERSGSEHRRAVTSFLLRRKAWLEVELPLERETEGFEKILL